MDKNFERDAARVNLRKMLDAKKRGERITAAEIVEATGFADWRSFGTTIHAWAKRSGMALQPVPNDGWRICLPVEHIDFAEARRRRALRNEKRGLKALIDIPRAELDDPTLRRADFHTVRAAARVQQAETHNRDITREYKLSERVPMRVLKGG